MKLNSMKPEKTNSICVPSVKFEDRDARNRPAAQPKKPKIWSAYDAQCTPDFFGFNAQDELQYRGRLDASRMTQVANARRDLFDAMKQVTQPGHGPTEQVPSMGCSIKWKDD